jgi:hypothetical protein
MGCLELRICAALMVVGLLACGESAVGDPRTNPIEGLPAGNGDCSCSVPTAAQEEDRPSPDIVIGNGTPSGCTSEALIEAVARGGAIYNDGNMFTLTVCGTSIVDNTANEGGGAIFFVSNDRSGRLVIEDSVLENNRSDGFDTEGYPGIFVLANGDPEVSNSVIR